MINISPTIIRTIFMYSLKSNLKAEYTLAIPIIQKNKSMNSNSITLTDRFFKITPSFEKYLFLYSVSYF